MNDKVYANYLMHGRTKGSRNGISTTKGYTAVGQKAKGKYVNGKWVYDDYSYHPSRNMWQQQAAATASKGTIPQNYTTKQYIHNENKNLNNKWNSQRAGAQNNWQQQAASQQYKDQQKRSAYANTLAKGAAMGDAAKAAEARNQTLARANTKNLAAQGAQNDWQQQANAKRDDVETYRRYKNNTIGGIAIKDKTGDVDVMYHPEAGYTAIKTIKEGAATKGSKNNWQQQASKAASRPTAGKQTNIGASQQAELERWKKQNQNAIAASKKASLKEELHRNAALNKYTKADWQDRANIARANTEVRNKVVSGESNKGYTPYAESGRVSNGRADEKTRNLIRLENLQNRVYAEQNKKAQEAAEKAKQSASYNKMSSTQKNAMQNDPRYSTGMKNQPNASVNKQEKAARDALSKATFNSAVDSRTRNSRSDLGNAIADAKEDAKNAFKALKKKLKKKK